MITLVQFAFANCSHITSVKFNDGLQIIGSDCFQNCTSLKQKLYLPNSIQNIDVSIFDNTQVEYDVINLTDTGPCCFSYVNEYCQHR